MTINLRDLSVSQAQLLTWALTLVKDNAYTAPTIFAPGGEREAPTLAEITHTLEIIDMTLACGQIHDAYAPFIAEALRYACEYVEIWIDSRPANQTERAAYMEFTEQHGIPMSAVALMILKCLARSICPHSEIRTTRRITTLPSDAQLAQCLLSLNKTTERTGAAATEVQWGQNNTGIVVEGVMYDLPGVHPVIAQLRDSIESYMG